MTGEADLAGYRVLVVEDEYYLASDAARALRGAGAEVVGPCSTEDAAFAEIDSFKLAEKLKEKAIPFAFVTGYDQEAILRTFDDVERLEKPTPLRHMVGAVAAMLQAAHKTE